MAEYFREIPDPRCAREHKHSHVEILLLIVLGFLAGKNSLRRIVKWAKRNREKLKKSLALKNGIPSLPTFSRIASGIDEELLTLAFTDWIGNILSTKGIHIVIDGKALRAATEKIKDKKAPYILNAMDASTNLVIAQTAVPEKTNEMTAIPKLLEILDITGSTVTIDAIGATEAILRIIEEKDGYFVQQIKKNCPATYQEIQDIFAELEKEKRQIRKSLQRKTKDATVSTAVVKRTGNAWNIGKSDATQTMRRSERYGKNYPLYAALHPAFRCGYQKKRMQKGKMLLRIRKPS